MAQLTTRRQYAANEALLKSDLDAFIDDVETFVNITQLNNDNFQDAGITASSKLVAASLTNEKFENAAVTTAKIADLNITTAKIADLAVTTAKILDANVTTAKIADGTVSTANIANDSVNGTKLESALKTVTADSFTSDLQINPNITEVESIEVTTTGGPVILTLNGHFGWYMSSPESLSTSTFLGSQVMRLYLMRAPTSDLGTLTTVSSQVLTFHSMYPPFADFEVTLDQLLVPGSIFKHFDVPAAGTYRYYLKVEVFTLNFGGTPRTAPIAGVDPRFRAFSAALVAKELV